MIPAVSLTTGVLLVLLETKHVLFVLVSRGLSGRDLAVGFD